MKKYTLLALALVLTASLLMGCGCTNRDMGADSVPTVLPTNEEVQPTTRETSRPTTEATTQPSSAATAPSETIDRGSGPLDSTTGTDTTENGTSRMMPNGNGSAGRSQSRG